MHLSPPGPYADVRSKAVVLLLSLIYRLMYPIVCGGYVFVLVLLCITLCPF